MGGQSTWGRESTCSVRLHGCSQYMVRQTTWHYYYALSVHTSSTPTQSHQSTWVIRVHGSCHYMVHHSTWSVRHKFHSNQISSQYMGRHSTWVVRVHGCHPQGTKSQNVVNGTKSQNSIWWCCIPKVSSLGKFQASNHSSSMLSQ